MEGEEMRNLCSKKHRRIANNREAAAHQKLAYFQYEVPPSESRGESEKGISGRSSGHSEPGISDACGVAGGLSARSLASRSGDLREPEPNGWLALSCSQVESSEKPKVADLVPTPRLDSYALGMPGGFFVRCEEKASDFPQHGKPELAEFAPSFFTKTASDGLPDLGDAEISGTEEYDPFDEPFMEDPLL